MNYPEAWEISRSVPPEKHDPHCSTAQTSGAILCDCAVLTEHPRYIVFDVDKFNGAIGEWDRLSKDKDARLSYPLLEIVTAARLVVAGLPLWWCEEHQVSAHNDDECWQQVWGQDDDYTLTRCRMVEGWWMPTGKDET